MAEAEAVKAAEALVQNVMKGWDGSHDWFHILRVRNLALSLASEEGIPPENLVVVELAALLHDIGDHKYASRVPKEYPTVKGFLESVQIEAAKKEAILAIVKNMGFAQELAGQGERWSTPEFNVVQDADRLDAIGAIGIGRTFTFGGSRNSVMHDPELPPRLNLTKEEYVNSKTKQSTINHFHEKLLKLKTLMKTEVRNGQKEDIYTWKNFFLDFRESGMVFYKRPRFEGNTSGM